jgi:hypothetical protein
MNVGLTHSFGRIRIPKTHTLKQMFEMDDGVGAELCAFYLTFNNCCGTMKSFHFTSSSQFPQVIGVARRSCDGYDLWEIIAWTSQAQVFRVKVPDGISNLYQQHSLESRLGSVLQFGNNPKGMQTMNGTSRLLMTFYKGSKPRGLVWFEFGDQLGNQIMLSDSVQPQEIADE